MSVPSAGNPPRPAVYPSGHADTRLDPPEVIHCRPRRSSRWHNHVASSAPTAACRDALRRRRRLTSEHVARAACLDGDADGDGDGAEGGLHVNWVAWVGSGPFGARAGSSGIHRWMADVKPTTNSGCWGREDEIEASEGRNGSLVRI